MTSTLVNTNTAMSTMRPSPPCLPWARTAPMWTSRACKVQRRVASARTVPPRATLARNSRAWTVTMPWIGGTRRAGGRVSRGRPPRLAAALAAPARRLRRMSASAPRCRAFVWRTGTPLYTRMRALRNRAPSMLPPHRRSKHKRQRASARRRFRAIETVCQSDNNNA